MTELKLLLEKAGIAVPCPPLSITGIEYDSRKCTKGSLFCAFHGIHTDGTRYLDDAIERGAVAIMSDASLSCPVPVIVVENVRSSYAALCAAFHDFPSRKLFVIGVTGTDGKTTTSEYLWQLLSHWGIHAGLLGTVSMDDGTGKGPSPYRQSTPEAEELQQFLCRCVEHGLTHVIVECTSHALSQEYDRLATVSYNMAIVTVVTSEHLEFHHSIERYVDAKCNLVRRLKRGCLFISTTDNTHLDAFLQVLPPSCKSVVLHRDIEASVTGLSVTYGGKSFPSSILEPVLVKNSILSSIACASIVHRPLEEVLPLLCSLHPVDGRMEKMENDLGLEVIIDFAHTADAYRNLFPFIRSHMKGGRLLALFGCAGERDKSKRAPMGVVASKYADVLFLTDEDPRNEETEAIDRDLLSNASPVETHLVKDRKEAIRQMVGLAREGDTLLFLGKGHEHSIEAGGKKIPWNEAEVVLSALKEKETCR